jgi:transposase
VISEATRQELRRLVLAEGLTVSAAARLVGVHHETARRALSDDIQPAHAGRSTQLDEHKPYVTARLLALPELTAVRIHDELVQRGYQGGIAQLRRFISEVRPRRSRKSYLHVSFEPGDQAQVDWGSFGNFPVDGGMRPLSCFLMVLSWSKALFIDFAFDQRMDTFLRMHERAFAYFGGVPKTCLYDNLKSVVLHRHGAIIQLNPTFLAYAGHMLFEPSVAPPYYPEAKGGVEAAVRHTRSNFFYGRRFGSLAELRDAARRWCDEVANQRRHATTREKPADRLLLERRRLRPLPERRFDTDLRVSTVVRKDARVLLDSNAYSVPHELVGTPVLLRADDVSVTVEKPDGATVCTHRRSFGRRQAVLVPDHVDAMVERRPNAQPGRRRERLLALSPEASIYLRELARRRHNLQDEVQKHLRLLDRYGEADMKDGIACALTRGLFGATYLRSLIDQARWERGQAEPQDKVVTGNTQADELTVNPHNLGDYDDLF